MLYLTPSRHTPTLPGRLMRCSGCCVRHCAPWTWSGRLSPSSHARCERCRPVASLGSARSMRRIHGRGVGCERLHPGVRSLTPRVPRRQCRDAYLFIRFWLNTPHCPNRLRRQPGRGPKRARTTSSLRHGGSTRTQNCDWKSRRHRGGPIGTLRPDARSSRRRPSRGLARPSPKPERRLPFLRACRAPRPDLAAIWSCWLMCWRHRAARTASMSGRVSKHR
jgi:hypothetical protein